MQRNISRLRSSIPLVTLPVTAEAANTDPDHRQARIPLRTIHGQSHRQKHGYGLDEASARHRRGTAWFCSTQYGRPVWTPVQHLRHQTMWARWSSAGTKKQDRAPMSGPTGPPSRERGTRQPLSSCDPWKLPQQPAFGTHEKADFQARSRNCRPRVMRS